METCTGSGRLQQRQRPVKNNKKLYRVSKCRRTIRSLFRERHNRPWSSGECSSAFRSHLKQGLPARCFHQNHLGSPYCLTFSLLVYKLVVPSLWHHNNLAQFDYRPFKKKNKQNVFYSVSILGSQWLVILCKFQMHDSPPKVKSPSITIDFLHPLIPPLIPFLSGNPPSVVRVWVCLFICCFLFYIPYVSENPICEWNHMVLVLFCLTYFT